MIFEKFWKSISMAGVSDAEVLAPQLDSFFVGRLIEGAIKDRRPFLASRLGWMESYALGLWDTGQAVEQTFIEKLRRHAGVFPTYEGKFRDLLLNLFGRRSGNRFIGADGIPLREALGGKSHSQGLALRTWEFGAVFEWRAVVEEPRGFARISGSCFCGFDCEAVSGKSRPLIF